MRNIAQDVRYGLRVLAMNPGFSVVAALTIALGIGANTAIFTVVNSILLRPLPFHDPDRLVRVFTVMPTYPHFPLNPADFVDFRRENHVFDGFAVYFRGDLQLSDAQRPERLAGMRVSSGYFECLGARPELGETFQRANEFEGSDKVVVLSDRLWRRKFAADPKIIGKAVRLSGEQYIVRGVMPPGFTNAGGAYRSLPYGEDVDVWWPLQLGNGQSGRGSHFLNGIARLRPGVSIDAAQSEMTAIAHNIGRDDPHNKDNRVEIMPLGREVVGKTERTLLLLSAAVAIVLLIACANVANLLLARAASRTREVAIRAAVGATTKRLVVQMMTESLLLALMGGAVGIAIASWGVDALLALRPDNLPRAKEIGIDGRVLWFALGISIVSGLLFGLVPAWRVRKADLNEALKRGTRGSSADVSQKRAGNLLVVAEVALAFILLTGMGLLLRTFVNIETTDPGFHADRVVAIGLSLPRAKYSTESQIGQFYARLVEQVRGIPGVEQTGAGSDLPWTGYDDNTLFEVEGRPSADPDANHARYHFQTPGFVAALGIPLIAGRDFTDSDTEHSAPIVLINNSMAQRYLAGETAPGNVLNIWGKRRTIAGVIGDVRDTPTAAGTEPAFYLPETQSSFNELYLVVRQAPGVNVMPQVLQTISKMDHELATSEIRQVGEVAAAAVSIQRFTLVVVAVFGTIAVLLAGIGIFGVMSYSVAQRTHDIGVQLALGAPESLILRVVVWRGLAVGVAGAVIGCVAALGATRALESLLYGVAPRDPVTFAAACIVVITVAVVAAWIPARRAIAVDPVVALRHE